MGLLNKLRVKETQIASNDDFWKWFLKHEQEFYKVVKIHKNIEEDFFNKLSEKLDTLHEGYWFLTGMYNDITAELIITSDGVVKNIVLVEELVKASPQLKNWKFTALKQPIDLNAFVMHMGDIKFSKDNLSFYANEDPRYPDEIDITIVHPQYSEDKKDEVTNGVYVFIDNYLGELSSVTSIDRLAITNPGEAVKELIPIEKLKGYLLWRESEFVEKYEGTWYNTDSDSYANLEGTLANGKPLFATINNSLLEWNSKASHPWILSINIKYKGDAHGLPDNETYDLMNSFENALMEELRDLEGYLNIGRETADHNRVVYFACKDFRLPSKVLSDFQDKYRGKLDMEYDIYKDKYWRSFERFKY